jgi:pimeloyl-ACP methyl ester carboxylesterase
VIARHGAADMRMQKVISMGRIVRGLRVDGPSPTWLLLPPLGVGASAWRPVLELLRGKHAAIALDFAGFGFGASDIGKGDPGYLEQQDLLTAFMDKSVHGSMVLAGCSTGALFCSELARREEHRLEAVFLSGFGLFADPSAWLAKVQQVSATPDALLGAMFRTPPKNTEELRTRAAQFIATPAHASFFDENAAAELARAFEELATPTLLFAGTDDALVQREDVERAAGRAKAAQIHWIENCGHLAPTERPGDFMNAAQMFLDSVHTRAGLTA